MYILDPQSTNHCGGKGSYLTLDLTTEPLPESHGDMEKWVSLQENQAAIMKGRKKQSFEGNTTDSRVKGNLILKCKCLHEEPILIIWDTEIEEKWKVRGSIKKE